jgi:hypothetical protein
MSSDRDLRVVIHAETDWYRERPEPEVALEGLLLERSVALGPGSRGGLDFALRQGDAEIPLYSAGAEAAFADAVGHWVRVLGKQVNLGLGGAEPELWVGLLERAPDAGDDK